MQTERAGELAGKSILITGAAAGIGAAAAELFAAEGAALVLVDRDAAACEGTAERLRDQGAQVQWISGDVTDAEFMASAVRLTQDVFGKLDGAFNNAGIAGPSGGLVDIVARDWNQTLEVNLTGIWNSMRAEITAMGAGAAIVNTSSLAGLIGAAQAAAYSASKHAINGLTKSVALEYGTAGIRINAIAPGPTRTPLLEKLFAEVPGSEERMVSRTALKRAAEPREIAQAALWLLSDRASYVTGQVVAIDGGQTAS